MKEEVQVGEGEEDPAEVRENKARIWLISSTDHIVLTDTFVNITGAPLAVADGGLSHRSLSFGCDALQRAGLFVV
jgi:hypothetical protein